MGSEEEDTTHAYYHHDRGLRTFLHGDDFATVGSGQSTAWLKRVIEVRFEIKSQCIGPQAKSVLVPGRRAEMLVSLGLRKSVKGGC